jgi:hypothetical protein
MSEPPNVVRVDKDSQPPVHLGGKQNESWPRCLGLHRSKLYRYKDTHEPVTCILCQRMMKWLI